MDIGVPDLESYPIKVIVAQFPILVRDVGNAIESRNDGTSSHTIRSSHLGSQESTKIKIHIAEIAVEKGYRRSMTGSKKVNLVLNEFERNSV